MSPIMPWDGTGSCNPSSPSQGMPFCSFCTNPQLELEMQSYEILLFNSHLRHSLELMATDEILLYNTFLSVMNCSMIEVASRNCDTLQVKAKFKRNKKM